MPLSANDFEKKLNLMFRNQFFHIKIKAQIIPDPLAFISVETLGNLLNAFTQITLNDYIQIKVPLLQIDLKNNYIRELTSSSPNKFHFSIGTITELKENRRIIAGFTETEETTQEVFNQDFILLAQELCQRIFNLLKLALKQKPALSSEELLMGAFMIAFKEWTTRDNRIIKASYFHHYLKNLKNQSLEKLQQCESAVFDAVYAGRSNIRANSISVSEEQSILPQEELPESQNILRYIQEQHQANFAKIEQKSGASNIEGQQTIQKKLAEWTQKLTSIDHLGFINQYINDLEQELQRENPLEKKYASDEMSCPTFLAEYVQLAPKEKLKTLFELYISERSLKTQVIELSTGIATLDSQIEKEKTMSLGLGAPSSAKRIPPPISTSRFSQFGVGKSPTSVALSSTLSDDTAGEQHDSTLVVA